MKIWADYVDEYELVTQSKASGGDAGDSCARTFAGLYWSSHANMNKSISNYFQATEALEHPKEPGLFRRHPNPRKWYSHWDRLSRDQMVPLLIASAKISPPVLYDIFLKHMEHLWLFAWNSRRNFVYPTLAEHLARSTPDVPWRPGWKMPDLTLFSIWSVYIRAFKLKWLRPILWIGDLDKLIGAIVIRYNPKRDDVMNHLLLTHYAQHNTPTLLSRLSLKICPYGLLLKRLDIFFGPAREPPLNELVRNILE